MLNIYLDEKGTSLKLQLPNIFKDHHIVAQPTPTTVGYDEWPLSLALWRKFYNSHGKYKPELNEYFHMYRCQLNFAMFCVTSALGISWQHLNHPNLLVRSVYRFHVYFHIRLILHELGISLPHEDGFSKVKNTYIKSAYYSTCDDYGVDRLRHGCMETGFIQQILLSLDTMLRLRKDLHQMTLHYGSSHSLKASQEMVLKK